MPKGVYERKLKPLIKAGDKFDKLTAVKFSYRNKDSYQFWLFRCDCGKEKIISINSVKRGNTKSCGCLLKKGGNLTHKMSKTRTYTSWQKMKERCLNKKCEEYKYYGKRGITICDRWLGKNGFINFYKDIGDTLKQGYANTNAWFITSNLEALKHIGLRPSRKIKVFNAKLEARLVKYEMYEGSKKAKKQNN